MKTNGKCIYQPKGKAREYSTWACNLFIGCSNDCQYCYLKRGVLKGTMGGKTPELKSGLEKDWLAVFKKEVDTNSDAIRRDGGLFFSFSTDPCLKETLDHTINAVLYATLKNIPCTILTKRAEWIYAGKDKFNNELLALMLPSVRPLVKIGISLSGYPKAEPNASSEEERKTTLKKLHKFGFKTFVSFEPILDIDAVKKHIEDIKDYCDEFKFGLLSGNACKTRMYENKDILKTNVNTFFSDVHPLLSGLGKKVFWKKSVVDLLTEENRQACNLSKQ